MFDIVTSGEGVVDGISLQGCEEVEETGRFCFFGCWRVDITLPLDLTFQIRRLHRVRIACITGKFWRSAVASLVSGLEDASEDAPKLRVSKSRADKPQYALL